VTDADLITSLERAVDAAPADAALRLHLAELLVAADRADEAVAHVALVLQQDPSSEQARALMTAALGEPAPPATQETRLRLEHVEPADIDPPVAMPDAMPFDWTAAEADLGELVPPMFADAAADEPAESAYDVEVSGLGLADVGGMAEVKQRLEAAFLAPMRNPELSRLYSKSLRGGLLLYGPPGCGKTFLARALAGELGAHFLSVSLADVLDMYVGLSERNLEDAFDLARRSAPCVLFLDEVDALGQNRSNRRTSAMRSTVNQLLLELDSVNGENEGVFVLAATNHPWDVDAALRRPGRLDRTVLVLPPDETAREAIFRHHLKDRPVERIDVRTLAGATDGFSGADIAHACETGAERALLDSATSGIVRMIGMDDLTAALAEVEPSLSAWFETARNVALSAEEGGPYDELVAYMRTRRLL
jgi:SpoVK/Ycf46/Vps4 family AAA+-type ATPase